MSSQSLKALLQRSLPDTYRSVQEFLAKRRLQRVSKVIESECGLVIQGGPFAGMAYVSEAVCSSLVPKLLGSYEAELQGVLQQLSVNDYDVVIDIGCAEGYYAVGLARLFPNAVVHAFDIDAKARALCEKLSQVNNVSDRVMVKGECDHQELSKLIQGRTLVVCDCEGCELQLLDPKLAPELTRSDLIVELHDMIDSTITPTIRSRFEPTHKINLIDAEERDPTLFPILRQFDHLTQRTAVAEFRDSPMQWAYLKARTES